MRFNYHSLSTEHNRTPCQLWASGCLLSYRSPNANIRDLFDQEMPSDLETYACDPDQPRSRGLSSSCHYLVPGSLLFLPPGAREKRPWLGLVTCLPENGRSKINDSREVQIKRKFVATAFTGEREVLL